MPLARASLQLWLCTLLLLIPSSMPDLTVLNPWLSACDLTRTSPSPRNCSASTPFLSCSKEHNQTTCQCLHYFTQTDVEMVCKQKPQWQPQILANMHLKHCHEMRVLNVLSPALMHIVHKGGRECERVLSQVSDVDALAANVSCDFADVLRRFDCQQPYTAKFNCDHCKEAYRRWVCTTMLPYYVNSTRIRPCRTLCQAVEQQCPYFLPADAASGYPTQYAGEPTFLCSDPIMVESGDQQQWSLYPRDDACCVTHCAGAPCEMCQRGTSCSTFEGLPSYGAAIQQAGNTSCEAPAGPPATPDCTLYSSPDRLPPASAATSTVSPSWSSSLLLLAACLLLPAPVPRPLVMSCVLLQLRLVVLADLSLLLFLGPHLCQLLRHLCLYCSSCPPKPAYPRPHSKRWQYYFILISVNLRAAPAEILPTPSMTPRGNDADRATSRKARLKLTNYFFSNLPIRGFTQDGVVDRWSSAVRLYRNNSGADTGWWCIRRTDVPVATATASGVSSLSTRLNHSLSRKYVWYCIKTNINETYIKKNSKQRLIKLKKTNRVSLVEQRHETNLEYVGLCDLEREHNVQCLANR